MQIFKALTNGWDSYDSKEEIRDNGWDGDDDNVDPTPKRARLPAPTQWQAHGDRLGKGDEKALLGGSTPPRSTKILCLHETRYYLARPIANTPFQPVFHERHALSHLHSCVRGDFS
jgi:hypothetical protein